MPPKKAEREQTVVALQRQVFFRESYGTRKVSENTEHREDCELPEEYFRTVHNRDNVEEGNDRHFILGSIVSDGKINEQEYILIYPALVKVFGSDFDFASVKAAVSKNYAFKKAVKDYSKELASTLAEADESFVNDVIGLCLCVVSIDGKISFREKNYIKKLYKA